MAIDLANIVTNTAKCVVPFMGQQMGVVYRPNVITTEKIENMQKRADSDDSDAFSDLLIEMIDDWDLTAAGKKVPLTVEGLKPVPLVLLRKILATIMEDAGSGEADAT